MKKFWMVLTAMVLAMTALARPVDPSVARRVAEVYLRAFGMRHTAALVDVSGETPFSEFYVFVAPQGGFVLVSGDDRAVPVLGYSTSVRFETKDMPDNLLYWLEGYEYELGRIRNSAVETSNPEWALLEAGEMPEPLLETAVAPMVTTTWNQSPYYNNLCPYDSATAARSVTGCVATATAQVMKYWNHPTTGYGSHTYTSNRTRNGVTYNFPNLSADFGSTTYQWSSMPTALTGASSSTQVNAVATLMYHIGVGVEMSYSPVASGAHNYNTRGTISRSSQTALMQYFKYRPDMAPLMRADYSDDEYSALLRAEIDQQRPVLYSGSNLSGGHSFVFDGYDNYGRIHVNWGWGGSNDGYFVMGSLNPGVGGIGGNSSGTYNQDNVALIGIRPNTNWSTSSTTTVSAVSNGNGTVSGSGSYSFGSTVTMQATPSAGYRFAGWSDGSKFNPREIVATGGSYTFTANFEPVGGDTAYYCPGDFCITSYGYSSGGDNYWGIRLPASTLNSDSSLRAVMLYVGVAGTYDLTVYTGTAHSTVAARDTVTFGSADVDQWQTVTLTTPVAATSDLWIIFHFSGAGYPQTGTYYSGAAGSFISGSGLSDNGASRQLSAMVKAIFCDCTAPVDSSCFLTTFPYTETFDSQMYGCWGVTDANGDGTTWTFYDGTYGYNNTPCIGIHYANNADDWLMTPPIAIATSYSISWKARIRSSSYPETYQVLWYDGTDTTVLFQETLSSTSYQSRSANFTVPAGGSGRVVFRYISNDMYYLYLDNIVISQTAPPIPQYTLTVTSNNAAWGSVSGGGSYAEGATATLTATANSGYHFVQWLPDGNTSASRTVTVTANASYTAVFEADPPVQYTLTVASNNGDWGTAVGGGTYDEGSVVTLTATPAAGYRFVQWQDGNTDNPRTVTVSGNATYTAIFEALPPTMYTLTAVSADATMGTVEGSGSYEAGSQVEIRAIAATGYHFTLWHDGNTENPRTVTVNTDITYTAYFVANTGIGDVEEEGVTLGVSGRTIMVGGAQAAFYDMLGRRLGTGSELTVEAAGVYLVRIGVKTYKVVIK
jgi:hypothetical protein